LNRKHGSDGFSQIREHPRNPRCVPRSTRRKVQQTEHLEEKNTTQCMFKGLNVHELALMHEV